ncbi:hypothetical protein [Alkalihalobacterium chitinilyticum]|uniref:Uncharacterized protein n=1 Tax=Alkalihalobacterium chitinilyticum TaxID=2980103 RepID=A0ABT5VCR4_9BACI|nr:hypothetical protein [Alkalihalobacterium chitinilyticum]MDE5413241.1 hypothetical protein [Alkalihalobacterium chitinilyticum]
MDIADIANLRMEKMVHKVEHYLREFDDDYEYCFIKDYELLFDDFKSQSIQVADCFVTLLEVKDKTFLTSLLFSKSYDVLDIVQWLDSHTISYNNRDQTGYFVKNAGKIIEAVKFKGVPIVLATRGKDKLYYDADPLVEVTERYEHFSQIVNTANANSIEII